MNQPLYSLDDLRRSTSVYKIETSSADLPSTFEMQLDLGGLEDVDYAYTTVDFFDPLSTFT